MSEGVVTLSQTDLTPPTDCVELEARAFEAQAQVVRAFWPEPLPDGTDWETGLAMIATTYESGGLDGLRAWVAQTAGYQRKCRLASRNGERRQSLDATFDGSQNAMWRRSGVVCTPRLEFRSREGAVSKSYQLNRLRFWILQIGATEDQDGVVVNIDHTKEQSEALKLMKDWVTAVVGIETLALGGVGRLSET